jgi:hypothetical protein
VGSLSECLDEKKTDRGPKHREYSFWTADYLLRSSRNHRSFHNCT